MGRDFQQGRTLGKDDPGEPPLDRIRKLLAHAEAAEYPQSEAYRNKAMEIMAKWNVDQATLEGDLSPDWQHLELYMLDGERYAFEFAHLLSAICNGLRSVRCIYVTGTYQACALVGPKASSESAIALFESLRSDMLTRAGELALKGPKYVSNYMSAYSQAIESRLLKMTKEEAPEGTGKDLVLADSLAKIDKYISEQLQDINEISPSYGSGYAQGAQDGMRADLGNSLKES